MQKRNTYLKKWVSWNRLKEDTQVPEIKGSLTINVNNYASGVSLVAINHDTNKVFEFTDFIMVLLIKANI
ncbi:hypothetical protein [Desulfosporosinus sp. BG]|uniref:hypothetical protein n=1 Tax=Desulfosporosinus sp. BG TaxID=1633135 RepID=UPI00083B9D9A|nr:hypothetical protein [Desulfosporosinus sp. BG]